MKRFLFILLFMIFLLSNYVWCEKNSKNVIRKPPYILYTGNNREMKLMWQLNSTENCNIQWGLDTSYSLGNVQTTQYGDDHQHKYLFTDLIPGQIYYYKLMVEQENYEGFFRAAPEENSLSIKFTVYGDTRSHPEIHDQIAAAIVSNYNNDNNYHTFVINTGDLVYNGSSESDWDNQFFNPYFPNIQNMLRTLSYQACVGNHEDSGSLFSKYFSYPFEAMHYWSFDYGDTHFAIIDQFVDYSPGTSEYNWLVDDLSSTEKTWKFIVLHKPGWSAGHHSNDTNVQNYIQPLCEQYGVSIVFAGHNHYYARAVVNGVVHITTGGGGAPLYQPDLSYPNIVTATSAYHFCIINIENNQLNFTAETPEGQIIDSFSLSAPSNNANNTQIKTVNIITKVYPNPFNPLTTISYQINKAGKVNLNIYNIKGEKVKTLVNEEENKGFYKVIWDGKDMKNKSVSNGVYIYRFSVGKYTEISKISLLK